VIRFADARLSASIMIICCITWWSTGSQMLWMTNASHPRTESENRA
jgi:hypothetical protein